MKKRGQELSTNTIIIVILAVLVLIVVAIFFTGGFAAFQEKLKSIWGSTAWDINEMKLECNEYCTGYMNSEVDAYKIKFCQKEFELDVDGDKKVDEYLTCEDATGITCQAIEDAGGCI
tara:strand:- start:1011 stop:1364 length:354 start_codon:yes stop_codon:yes gene_type:complete